MKKATYNLYTEDSLSQIPALQMLMKMGWKYLSPSQALHARGGREANVLLEDILRKQLKRNNSIEYKGKKIPFTDNTITDAVVAIRNLPEGKGFIASNKYFYELITLGKSFSQRVMGDKKSFSLHYIDWEHPENNAYHVTEEFSVLRGGRKDHYRPDIVLFINGIPMVVIECKSPSIKNPVNKAIEQHLRNQQKNGIRSLYRYSNLLFSLTTNVAKYGTTGTPKDFWGVWKEKFYSKEEKRLYENKIKEIKHRSLPDNERSILFKERFKSVLQHFDELEKGELSITAQDKILYSLCRHERLLQMVHDYILYDDGIKKIARYQQYIAVEKLMRRILKRDESGKHIGGVVWHTQGSGKSLTMIFLAEQIASHPEIKNPKIVLVTDRISLDSQITETFRKCQVPVENAQTGKHLVRLIGSAGDAVITTLVHKFESAVKHSKKAYDSTEIYVLIDEGHRTQYGELNIKMQQVFPRACYIAFTGTPLLKNEKNTAHQFGGIVDVYSIKDAVEDGAVVPLLYEGRHNLIQVNEKPLDTYFGKVSEPLTEYGKSELKRKYSGKNTINKADQVIYARAWDISEHYVENFQGTGFKGQVVTPYKATAIQYKKYFDEIGKVSSAVIISAPDMREGEEDAFAQKDLVVKKFWEEQMDKYGGPERYETSVINHFKHRERPELIIVVDKLLTGFDAPRNTVLYITRSLKEHTLLQAIARVNRIHPGKEYGYIIDYYGNLENLDAAIKTYSSDAPYDKEELEQMEGTWQNIEEEIKKLPQAHSELWDIFKTIKNKYDQAAYEELLADEEVRHRFYKKVSEYSRLLKMALSSLAFHENTSVTQIDKYKADSKFFLALRVSVKRRYSDDVDYKEFEAQIEKLIDKHITVDGETLKLTDEVDIFNKDEREEEVEKLVGKAAKADHISSRTVRATNMKMDEDPVFYKKLSELIKKTIEDYHQKRIDEAEYLKKAKEYEETFLKGHAANVPEVIKEKESTVAIYNLVSDTLEDDLKGKPELFIQLAMGIDEVIRSAIYDGEQPIVDWKNNSDVEGKIKIAIDDFIFGLFDVHEIEIDFEDIDYIIDESYNIARAKF